MKSITNTFKNIDYFGREFKFSVMGNEKSKSFFGVIVSLCCLAMVVVTTLLFGSDFYNKQNPRIYSENIKAIDYKAITLFPSNFILAFRIEEFEGNPTIDPENYFSLEIYHRSFMYNTTTKIWDDESFNLEIVPCNETLAPDPKFHVNRVLSEWKCILFPEQGIKLGGSWNGNFIHSIYFQISNCNSTSCSNIT